MNDGQLRQALRETSPPDEQARRRAWSVVSAAYAERQLAGRRRHRGLVAAVATALAAVIAVTSLSAPRDAVARLMREVLGIGGDRARPALVHVPGGGRLLVQAPSGTWVVAADGSRRRVGRYDGASWSPHGLFFVAWRNGQLTAAEPGGQVRWSLARRQAIRVARWAPVDGFRIAYLAGRRLRVVNGDGTGDRRLAPARPAVPPAWRPDKRHVLAYADPAERVRVVAVDSGTELWRSRRLPGTGALAWSSDGRRLAAATRRRVVVFGGYGRRLASFEAPAGHVIVDVAWQPGSWQLVVVRHDRDGRHSEVSLREPARGSGDRVLLSGPGRFGSVAWSPAGRRLLIAWPEADQWVFVGPGGGRATAVGDISRHFDPAGNDPRFPERVEWCCPAAGG